MNKGRLFSRKKNNLFSDVLQLIRENWMWCVVTLLIAASRMCWYGMLQPYKVLADSKEYIAFDTVEMLQGHATNGRAPLYGMFLDALELLFADGYLTAAAVIQTIVSTISIVIFAKLLGRIGVRSPWKEGCVFFYGVTPAVVGWEVCIMTESFSLSGAVLFLYFAVLYIQEHRFRYGVISSLLAVTLAFLRPQFMVYMALLLAFYILKLIFPYDKSEQRTLLSLLLLQIVCWAVVFSYCAAFQKQFGIFSLSDALPRQNLKVCVDRGYYGNLDDEEIAQYITEGLGREEDPWLLCLSAVDEYGNARVAATTKRYFYSHFAEYLSDTVQLILSQLGTTFYGYAYNDTSAFNFDVRGKDFIFTIYPIQMRLFGSVQIIYVLVATVLEGTVMLAAWIKRRTLPWIHMALFSIAFCTTFVTFFATSAEYMRTMSSVMPVFCCIVGLLLQMGSDYSARCRQPGVSDPPRRTPPAGHL